VPLTWLNSGVRLLVLPLTFSAKLAIRGVAAAIGAVAGRRSPSLPDGVPKRVADPPASGHDGGR
jgi:hypothetical protein